jgi:uncharacterized protein (DUF427 family)
MMRVTWNGAVIAESDRTVVVEGNHYFPPDAVNFELLRPRQARSLCFWKGIARYSDVVVDGQVNRAAAWSYAHPSPLARRIRGHVAFWGGVRIEEVQLGANPDAICLGELQVSSASRASATPGKSSADTSGGSKIGG